jgi:DNA processing protein
MTDPRAEERLARAALTRVAEPAEPGMVRAVARQGALTTWDQVRAGADVPGISAELMGAVRARLPHDPDGDLEALERVGGRFLIPGDDEWPERLRDLGERIPIGLWVCGPTSLADMARSVAIVGSRAATAYGERVAMDLGYDLASRAWLVVSGGAYGIDGAAHRGALGAEGETVAVLACGVDVSYPRGHERLFDRIRATGAIVSEWPPGCAPMRHRFLTRNRVIAAMTAGTVVVEAGARSGARSTAREATGIGRTLMAVPGPVTSALSVGCHQLLRQEGVRCVTSAAEIIEELGRIGELAPLPQGPVLPRDDLSPQLRRVLEAVPKQRGATPEAIARTAGVSANDVRQALVQLVGAGFVEAAPGGWRLAGARQRSTPAARSLFDD